MTTKENIKDTKANSQYIKKLPEGCKLCINGKKSVLFLTGLCDKNCFYCPLSEQKKGKNSMWINEKYVKSDTDIIDEIKKCGSEGVGITGGEPLLDITKFCKYVKLLKAEFGENFHIHAYTTRCEYTEQDIKMLNDSGLNALRFHIFDITQINNIKDKFTFKLGIEIPLIPEKETIIKKLIKDAEGIVNYINLNELEFSDTNHKQMEKHNLTIKENDNYAVSGSKELGLNLLQFAQTHTKSLSVHFCSAATKYDYQYQNRLKHRAENIKKPWEEVTRQGFIKKGVIFEKLENVSLKPNTYIETKDRIETSIKNAKKVARKGFKAAIVLQMPLDDSFDFELTYIDKKGRLIE